MGIFKCIFVIIGSIIGAGFASGKEIYSFFFIYGDKGKIGVVISLLLIGCIIYKSLKIIKKYEVNNYDEFLKIIIKSENKKIEFFINFIINTFLLITFFVMCAGYSAYFYQEFKINLSVSGIIISIFSYLILNKNIKGIILLNSVLIPLIIIILFIIGIKSYGNIENNIYYIENNKWIIKAILYASYNTVTLISILIPMKKFLNKNKDIFRISFISTMIILLMAQIIYMLLLSIKADINSMELPAVYASR